MSPQVASAEPGRDEDPNPRASQLTRDLGHERTGPELVTPAAESAEPCVEEEEEEQDSGEHAEAGDVAGKGHLLAGSRLCWGQGDQVKVVIVTRLLFPLTKHTHSPDKIRRRRDDHDDR